MLAQACRTTLTEVWQAGNGWKKQKWKPWSKTMNLYCRSSPYQTSWCEALCTPLFGHWVIGAAGSASLEEDDQCLMCKWWMDEQESYLKLQTSIYNDVTSAGFCFSWLICNPSYSNSGRFDTLKRSESGRSYHNSHRLFATLFVSNDYQFYFEPFQ